MLLAIKLTLTPLLIAAATLIARRWGNAVGGWIAALPLTSGPVSIFFALEQGLEFTAAAAQNSILGITAVSAFCVGYAKSAKRFYWPTSLAIAYLCYTAAFFLLSLTPPSLPLAIMLAFTVMSIALMVIGHPVSKKTVPTPPWWDMPMRMLAATAMLLAVTGAAALLGPKWSGLISPFPVFACVMSIFSHIQLGGVAAAQLLRGIISGCYAFAAFFVVVTLMVQTYSLITVYALASVVAIAMNLATLKLAR